MGEGKSGIHPQGEEFLIFKSQPEMHFILHLQFESIYISNPSNIFNSTQSSGSLGKCGKCSCRSIDSLRSSIRLHKHFQIDCPPISINPSIHHPDQLANAFN